MAMNTDVLKTVVQLEGAQGYMGGLKGIAKESARTAEQQKKLAESYRRASNVLIGASVAAGGIVAASVQKYMEQETALRKLHIVYGEGAGKLADYAASLQEQTRYGDEAIMAGMTLMATFPTARAHMEEATKAALNLSEVYGIDLATSFLQLGKASMGEISLLRRMGVNITKAEVDAKGFGAVLDVLAREVGQAAFEIDDVSKSIDQMRNAVGDLGEEVGKEFAPTVSEIAKSLKIWAESYKELSPATKQVVTDLLMFGPIAGLVAAVVLKLVAFRLAQKANAAIVAQTQGKAIAGQKLETAAVRESAVAYNELGIAKLRAATTGGTGTRGAGVRGAMGARVGGTGTAVLGLTVGVFALVEMYRAMVVPALKELKKSQDSMTEAAKKWEARGGGWRDPRTGAVWQGRMPSAEEWLAQRPEAGGQPVSPLRGWRKRFAEQQMKDQLQPWAGGLGPAPPKPGATAEERAQVDIETFRARTQVMQSWLERLKLGGDKAARLVAIEEQLSSRTAKYVATLRDEAKAHLQLADELDKQAAANKNEVERKKLATKASRERVAAYKLETDAQKIEIDLTGKLRDAHKEMTDERKRAAQEARQEAVKATNDYIALAQAQLAYYEQLYKGGKDDPRLRGMHGAMGEILEAAAREAYQMGELTQAYQLAAAALQEFDRAQVDVLGTMRQLTSQGEAYADYLEAIGAKERAAQYRRGVLSAGMAQQAQYLFAQGKGSEAWQAAASAERLARAGTEKGAGQIAGFGGGLAGRALTQAVPTEALGRVPTMVVNPHVTVTVKDEVGNLKRVAKVVRTESRQADYYDTFRQ